MSPPIGLRLERLVAWFPIALLGAITALTYWLDAQLLGMPAGRDAVGRHDPDMVVENFSLVAYGKNGRVEQKVVAPRARHFPDDETTEFEGPTFVVTETDRPKLDVTARRARLTSNREHVYFDGDVRAQREAAGDDQPISGPLTLVTESLHVMPKTQRLQTDRAVTITEPRAIIRGVGLDYDHQAKVFRLSSSVSGQFMPPR